MTKCEYVQFFCHSRRACVFPSIFFCKDRMNITSAAWNLPWWCGSNGLFYIEIHFILHKFLNDVSTPSALQSVADRTDFGLLAKKKTNTPWIQKNIAMTDCLQAGYSITRQSVTAIFFLYLWCASFFSAWGLGLVYLGPYSAVLKWPK